MNRICLVLLHHDLRVSDQPALFHAAAEYKEVVPVYVLDDASAGKWKYGGASRCWLHYSLKSLQKNLGKNCPLILRNGDTVEEILDIAGEIDAEAILWNKCCVPYRQSLMEKLKGRAQEKGIAARQYNETLLFSTQKIKNKNNEYYKIFTPFWKACLAHGEVRIPYGRAKLSHSQKVASFSLDDLKLLPFGTDWSKGIWKTWSPGEEHAEQLLDQFVNDKVCDYADLRDRPDKTATSFLSPYLHFGEISPHTVWEKAQKKKNRTQEKKCLKAIDNFLSEIGWREFSHYLLNWSDRLPDNNFNSAFDKFQWENNEDFLYLWQKGKTGYPIVDAGMRQLWTSGWMHNRVRMITASFLTKDLLVHWKKGEEWFWDTLVDADLANNNMGWQWTAGCGADAAPYFRIFNPVTQGKKFDPDGDYIRAWIPELSALPSKWIHEPWNTPDEILQEAGVRLGKDYPKPIVDHRQVREKALELYKNL